MTEQPTEKDLASSKDASIEKSEAKIAEPAKVLNDVQVNNVTSPDKTSENREVDKRTNASTSRSDHHQPKLFVRDRLVAVTDLKLQHVPIVHIYYQFANGTHMTVVFTAVGPAEQKALHRLKTEYLDRYNKILVTVTDQKTPFSDTHNPQNSVVKVKPKLPPTVLKMCEKINRFKLIPHVSCPPDLFSKCKSKSWVGVLQMVVLYPTSSFRPNASVEEYIGIMDKNSINPESSKTEKKAESNLGSKVDEKGGPALQSPKSEPEKSSEIKAEVEANK